MGGESPTKPGGGCDKGSGVLQVPAKLLQKTGARPKAELPDEDVLPQKQEIFWETCRLELNANKRSKK